MGIDLHHFSMEVQLDLNLPKTTVAISRVRVLPWILKLQLP